MLGYRPKDKVADHYDDNAEFASVLNAVIPEFEYPDWSHLTIAQLLGRIPIEHREKIEDALNGWSLADKKMTPRQEQFVSEHSGEMRSEAVREAIAQVGSEALELARSGNESAARAVMMKAGLSQSITELLLRGWKYESMYHEPEDKPAVCCVVNALAERSYVGRIVQMTGRAVWQEVEPGQIVEHAVSAIGDGWEDLEMAYWASLDGQKTHVAADVPDHDREPWRFANGFVDDVLYYAEGQQKYEEAIAKGDDDLANDILGQYNLAYQKELSGFTLDDYGRAYDEAQAINQKIGRSARIHNALTFEDYPWDKCWRITYDNEGKAVAQKAALLLVREQGVMPNPFVGRVISETQARYVQDNGNDLYSGHLKEMTGELEIGEHYSIRYRRAMGKQRVEVNGKEVGGENTVVEEPAGVDKTVLETPRGPMDRIADALNIGVEIYKKLNVVVPTHDITACVEGSDGRGNAQYSGRIMSIEKTWGLVVQSCGRQTATVHRLADFAGHVPDIGENCDVKYRGGRMIAPTKEREQAQGIDR